MKVLMLIRFLHYSGAPKMFLWVAKSLADLGNDVTVLTWAKNTTVEIPSNINIKQVDIEKKWIVFKIKYIRSVIKELNPDVSISFLLDSNIFNILACKGLRTKSIVCERNDPFKPRYYKLKLLKPIFRWADGAVFQLPKVADYYNNIKSKTAIIPNPVVKKESCRIMPFTQRDKVITTLGRLDIFQKRTDLLIEAFALFYKDHPDYILRLWGDGPDESELRKKSEQLGISKYVEFAGKTDNPIQSILNSQIFVLSSDFEGIPNALIEAMSVGLTCVATDCRPGGAALLINDKNNGLLVPCGSKEDIAGALNYLCQHPAEADKYGRNAFNITECFSEYRIATEWNNYIKLLAHEL